MHDSMLTFRRAASQFLDDFESAVIDALPAFAAHAYERERDAIEDAVDDARTAAHNAGASDDEARKVTRAALDDAEAASSIVSIIHQHGRACHAEIEDLPCGDEAEAILQRVAHEAARAIAGAGGVRPN